MLKEETIENHFGFTGEQYDPVAGMYYLRARFYNPVIGRFIQEDTYYGDGLNLYTYCHNNPVRYVDPSGHACYNKETAISILKANLGEDIDVESIYKQYKAKYKNAKAVKEALEKEYGKLTPAQRAALAGYAGIGTSINGGPDFRGTDYIYKNPDGVEVVVKIKMTGSRAQDFNLANLEAGFTNFEWGKSAVESYTWHHFDDYDPVTGTCTMQLVYTPAHQKTVPHIGSCAQYDAIHGPTYNK